ncbi:unnamed protein product [Schistocephalus solidus]|uniref:Uncharacterized protein n=1 Tax=Schistocephalus solidus TaxID=70667 RepID=A0A183SY74_SCHSO|nr:unnamed protein product [Schistocephalus solidus]
MDDERLPKRLFYGDVTTGARRQGGQKRRYKDTLKKSLKHLQINPAIWEDLAQDRPAWRLSMKTGAAIYEANRIAAAKAKRVACNSQVPRIKTVNAQALPTCPRCQRTFHPTTTMITPTTDNNFIKAPPPTITDTILPLLPAPITATNTTCPTHTTQ